MSEREALSLLLAQGYRWVWNGTQRIDLAAFISTLEGSDWPEVSIDYSHPCCRLWGVSPDKTVTLLYTVCKDQRQI